MIILTLLLLGAGLAWVYHNPQKAASWLTDFSKKKKSEDKTDEA